MRSDEQIVRLYKSRRDARYSVLNMAQDVSDAYDDEMPLPLPELDRNEAVAVANLFKVGIDHMAWRIASVTPTVRFFASSPGKRDSERHARIARRAVMGWWEQNRMPLVDERRARWFIAYAGAPVSLWWDARRGVPRWQERNPLHTFPSQLASAGDLCPDDCVFSVRRTWGWLRANYPQAAGQLRGSEDARDADRLTLLEYMDVDERVLLVVASTDTEPDADVGYVGMGRGKGFVRLEQWPNLCGLTPVVVPTRLSLNDPRGQFDGMVGMYQQQAVLMALATVATRRGIFREQWAVGFNEQSTPQVVTPADPEKGVIGVVKGGKIESQSLDPSFMTPQMISVLERFQRVTGGIPAEFGGEAATNVRTGRRGDSIMSATVDFPVMAAHRMFEASKEEENKIAIAIARAYGGDERRSFYVSAKGAVGKADYVPNIHLASDSHRVRYPNPGMSVNDVVTGGLARVGAGTLSKRTFMEVDPMVEDDEREHDRALYERMEEGVLVEFQQPGTMGLPDKARVMELVLRDELELVDAIRRVQEEAQERQATPVEQGAPESMPGIVPPGLGAEQPTVRPAPQGLGNLAQLMQNIRRTN